jgi:hypothetical protein
MIAFIQCCSFFQDRGEKHVVLSEARSYFVRLPDNQVQGKCTIYAARNIDRLFDIPLVMPHNNQQIYVAIFRGRAPGIGAEEDNLFGRELVRNPPYESPNVTPVNHASKISLSLTAGKDFARGDQGHLPAATVSQTLRAGRTLNRFLTRPSYSDALNRTA